RATNEFVCVEVWHPPAVDLGEFETETKGRRAKLLARMGLLGRVLQSGEPTWIADVSADSYYGRVASARKSGIHAGFCFPIKLGAEVLGFVECYSRQVRAPDPDFVRALAAIGVQLGHFIERERAEQALELVSRLPAENPAPVLRLKGAVIAFANPAAGSLLALWRTAVGGEAPAQIAEVARAALADGRKRAINVDFDGGRYSVTFAPIVEENYVNLYFQDIPERMRD
ncbi:MAG TPA: GAF domain-containing protein, partial [Verrucomicrobiae bacterium]|nr:GAF domain-containing protein [Verrucomicrobiae bacterium]